MLILTMEGTSHRTYSGHPGYPGTSSCTCTWMIGKPPICSYSGTVVVGIQCDYRKRALGDVSHHEEELREPEYRRRAAACAHSCERATPSRNYASSVR